MRSASAMIGFGALKPAAPAPASRMPISQVSIFAGAI
jgi:hypothetical protein